MRKLNGWWLGGALVALGAGGCGASGSGTAGGGLGTQASPGTGGSATGGTGGGGTGGSTTPARLSDAQVVTVLKTANQGEVDQAKAALSCLTNDKVKAFANEMITDHSAALARIDALIASVGSADSPENAALMDVGQQQLKLITDDAQSGGCDQVYVKVQIDAHSTVLGLIDELLAPSAQSPAVVAEVQNEKPVVQMHLDMANQLKPEVGIARATDGGPSACGGPLTEGQVVKWLMVSNQGEVDDGTLAVHKATTPEAKAFGQRMIDDHGAALARVQALATKLGLTPMESEESQNKKIAGDVADEILNSLLPPKFDLAYIDIEVLDHYDDLDTIDAKLLPSSCSAELKAEVQAERGVVATHESIARTVEPVVRAAAGH